MVAHCEQLLNGGGTASPAVLAEVTGEPSQTASPHLLRKKCNPHLGGCATAGQQTPSA